MDTNTNLKSTKRKSPLLPPTVFLLLVEVAARWRRTELSTERMLRKFGVPVYRLTAKAHLYALEDIERIEEQAKVRPPLVVRTSWRKQETSELK